LPFFKTKQWKYLEKRVATVGMFGSTYSSLEMKMNRLCNGGIDYIFLASIPTRRIGVNADSYLLIVLIV